MKTYAFITGRNYQLSLEELITVLHPLGQIVEVHPRFLIFQGEIDGKKILAEIGGTVKVAEVVYDNLAPREVTPKHIVHLLRNDLKNLTGRLSFGASVYGGNDDIVRQVKRLGLEVKKYIRDTLQGRARFVYNNEGVLSSVAVKKEHLYGREILFLLGKRSYIAVTEEVQDFESYSKKDVGRPSRNMVRGMLPPKVAKIMLNLAGVKKQDRVLDPFCGGGTILQEALLLGVEHVYGSDSDPKAIKEAQSNIDWLLTHFNIRKPNLAVADVFSLREQYSSASIDVVVTEPYLGPARLLKQRSLTRQSLDEVRNELWRLYKHLFDELSTIMTQQGKIVIIFPLFKLMGNVYPLGELREIEKMGWKLRHPSVMQYLPQATLSPRKQLLYQRDDQVVTREILVWEHA